MKLADIKVKFENSDLPPIQKDFIENLTDIKSLLKFDNLHLILNPTFSYHYFLVDPGHFSFQKGEQVGVITTKHTTGESEAWGEQSKEAEHNAFLLAQELKQYFRDQELFLCDGARFSNYTPETRNKRRLYFKIQNGMYKINGLTAKNILE